MGLTTLPAASADYPLAGADLFGLFAAVESLDGRRLTGDDGRSLGLYHLSRAYWSDGCEFGGVDWPYEILVHSPAHCRAVMTWYWMRYCPGAIETLARIHNGGPEGTSEQATIEYWHRIRTAAAGERSPR